MPNNMFCKRMDITNEADVESFFLLRLFKYLGFQDKDIQNKDSLAKIIISRGSKKENYKPDFVLTVGRQKPKIVIDAKDPKENVDDYFSQVSGYALGLNKKFEKETPIEFTILANGNIFKLYKWDKEKPIITLEFNDFSNDNHKFKKLIDIISYKSLLKRKIVARTIPSNEFEFRKPSSNDEIEAIFRACHQIIWNKENIKPSEAFPEFAKLFFIKIYFDRKIHEILKAGEEPNLNDFIFSINWIENQERELDDKNPVANILFKKLKEDLEEQIQKGVKKRIFNRDEELNISPSTIKEVVLKYKLIEEKDLNKLLSPEEMTKPKEADRKLVEKIKNSENYKKFLEGL